MKTTILYQVVLYVYGNADWSTPVFSTKEDLKRWLEEENSNRVPYNEEQVEEVDFITY